MLDIRERLRRGDLLVGDGAWGTLLMERGLKPGEPPDMASVSRPEVIEEIAGLYLAAGADLITTNTFGASPLKLRIHGLEEMTDEINRQAVAAARRAVGGRAYVSASVGPSGRLLKPHGDANPDELYAGFELQIRAQLNAGADMVCVETMADLTEAALAVKAARTLSPLVPILATMTFENTPRGFFTMMGVTIERAAAGLEEAGADIVGSNCGSGIDTMIGIARELRKHSALPLAIQANAGMPVLRDGRTVFPETPDYMADKAPELLAEGVQIIGGCCGTGPAHIAALRRAVDAFRKPLQSI